MFKQFRRWRGPEEESGERAVRLLFAEVEHHCGPDIGWWEQSKIDKAVGLHLNRIGSASERSALFSALDCSHDDLVARFYGGCYRGPAKVLQTTFERLAPQIAWTLPRLALNYFGAFTKNYMFSPSGDASMGRMLESMVSRDLRIPFVGQLYT